ncbi:MAG: hypothetical protein DRH37_02465 [Deltaproteobacteria bacterium]|nr:MAG: hypothetical protein DRH37_02465 [Deltaproteobacteria bacterium]
MPDIQENPLLTKNKSAGNCEGFYLHIRRRLKDFPSGRNPVNRTDRNGNAGNPDILHDTRLYV